jgi:Flp pilus assembly secretin CpaC
MSTGVDWKKLFAVSGSPLNISLNTAGTVANSALNINYTNASVQAVMNLVEKNTNARTLARQRFPAFNNTLSMMFDGKKVPYVGKVQQSTAGTSGTTTSSGEFEYAMDGISTAVYTNVLDNNQVELTLMPVLSSIENWATAEIGGNTMTAPIQPLRQGHFPFIGKHGQTLVFGGGRYGRESLESTGVPGVAGTALNKIAGGNNQDQSQKELVFLVNTKIIPMTKFEPLVRESL